MDGSEQIVNAIGELETMVSVLMSTIEKTKESIISVLNDIHSDLLQNGGIQEDILKELQKK